MNVGFTVCARGGEAAFHLRDHGQKDRPALVTQAAVPGVRVVLMGRLYYHAELCAGPDLAAVELRNRGEVSDAAERQGRGASLLGLAPAPSRSRHR